MTSFDVKRMSPLQESRPRPFAVPLRAPCGACAVRELTLCTTLEEIASKMTAGEILLPE